MISYKSHNDALKKLNIESLEDRRKSLCLKFAKKCLQVEKLKKLFPNNLKSHTMLKRGSDKFKVNRSLTTRYSPNAENAKERLMRVDIKPYQAISTRVQRDYFSRSKSPAGTVLLLLNTTILTFLWTI